MRTLLAVFALGICCLPAYAGELKPIATVHLPCESRQQFVSPSGDQIVVHCSDHGLRLIDVATGREQHAFTPADRVTGGDFSRDGRWFAVGLWDGSVEIVPTSGSGAPKRWQAGSRRIEGVRFLADGSIVISAIDQPGQVWDVSGTPKPLASLHADFAGMTACAVSPDGKLLATAEGDTILRVYDTSTWKIVSEYRGLKLETFAVAFTGDGKYLLAGGADDHISVIDVSSGAEVHRLEGETGVVYGIFPLSGKPQVEALYADADGIKPPHQVVWDLDTRKAKPLITERAITGGGVVRGKLWATSADGSSLQIWEYE